MKAKTSYGEFEVVGYEALNIHYPIGFKPDEGFVYVAHSDGTTGAIPKKYVLNWCDLPKRVELSEERKAQRDKCPDYIRQQKG